MSLRFLSTALVLFLAAVAAAATANASAVHLAWDPNAEPDVIGYRLYLGDRSGSYQRHVPVNGATEATVADLAPEATYYFAVTAVNTAGLESAASNEVQFTVPRNPAPPPPPNLTPSVSVVSPGVDQKFKNLTRILFKVAASDPDGAIARTEYLINGSLVAGYTGAVLEHAWTPPGAAQYLLCVRVTDNAGAVTVSTTVPFAILSNGNNRAAKRLFRTRISSREVENDEPVLTLASTNSGAFSATLLSEGEKFRLKGRFDERGEAALPIQGRSLPHGFLHLRLFEGKDAARIEGALLHGRRHRRIQAEGGQRGPLRPQAERWVLLFPVDEETSATETDPQGVGYASMVISRSGTVRLRGHLADGTPIRDGGAVVEGRYGLSLPLYKGGGRFAASIVFREEDGADALSSGEATWSKVAGLPKQKRFIDGFDLQLRVAGEALTEQSRRSTQLQGAGTLQIWGGNLPSPIQLPIRVRRNAEMGLFSGTLSTEFGREAKVRGAILNPKIGGAGFFTLPGTAGGVALGLP
jgi:hypothetical protein